jgi:hypothetical protein
MLKKGRLVYNRLKLMVESAQHPAPERDNPFILPGELPSWPRISLQPLRAFAESFAQRQSAFRKRIPAYSGRIILVSGLLIGGGTAVWSYSDELGTLGKDISAGIVDFFGPQSINFVNSDFGQKVEPMP